jgi:hypothetical protein
MKGRGIGRLGKFLLTNSCHPDCSGSGKARRSQTSDLGFVCFLFGVKDGLLISFHIGSLSSGRYQVPRVELTKRLALSDLSKEQRFRKVGDIAVGLLKVQRSFIDKDKFVITDKVGKVNGKALGYVFGMLDALLQCANLDIRDVEGEAALHSVIARMFPAEVVNAATYFGRLKNIESELEITNGITLGRKQATDWLRHKTPPVRWTTCFWV